VPPLMRIPTKKIAHSELMKINPSPSDAVKSILKQLIVSVKPTPFLTGAPTWVTRA
jgi:hypothetical protein